MVADQDATVSAIDWALTDIAPIGSDVADFDDQFALIADYENDQTRATIAKAIVDGVKLNSVEGLSDEAQAAKSASSRSLRAPESVCAKLTWRAARHP